MYSTDPSIELLQFIVLFGKVLGDIHLIVCQVMSKLFHRTV